MQGKGRVFFTVKEVSLTVGLLSVINYDSLMGETVRAAFPTCI